MAFAHNPYDDGFACERIAQTLLAGKSLFPLASF
jgi:UDP-N-acetylglucosamine 2-epimerase